MEIEVDGRWNRIMLLHLIPVILAVIVLYFDYDFIRELHRCGLFSGSFDLDQWSPYTSTKGGRKLVGPRRAFAGYVCALIFGHGLLILILWLRSRFLRQERDAHGG